MTVWKDRFVCFARSTARSIMHSTVVGKPTVCTADMSLPGSTLRSFLYVLQDKLRQQSQSRKQQEDAEAAGGA